MKNKNLLFSLLTFVVAGTIIVIAASGISKKNNYAPRNSTIHKATFGINGAIDYLASIRNNKTTGDIDPKWVFQAREEVDALTKNKDSKTLGLSWSELGPDNIGGRTRAILIDKNDPNIMYAGGVSGGLWKSTTGGSSWNKIDDFADNLAITSIAQGADGTLYVGTGEGLGYGSGSANGSTSFIGKGIFKSTDGSTFTSIASTVPSIANNSGTAWAYVNRIACDPVNPSRIYAATNNGIRSTDNGGTTWIWPVKLTNGNDNKQNATDVDVASNNMVVCVTGNKCYISPTGNNSSFVNESTGGTDHLPISGVSRVEMAIAPSNPNYIYASAAQGTAHYGNCTLKNIYMSSDAGNTWTIIGPGGSGNFQPFGTQGDWDNAIAVHPTNPTRIFVGGLDLWEWQPNSTWTQKSIWYLPRTSSYYIHADHHFYLFHPTNPNILFVGSDGGISRSIDCGETFQTMNINYNTLQSYALSVASDGTIMTGTQDNGTIFLPRLGAFPKHGEDIMGGDGGWSAFSDINPEAYFATVYNGGTRRSPNKGATFFPGGDWSSPFFAAKMLPGGSYSTAPLPGDGTFPAAFVTPFLLWESYNDIYSSDSLTFTPLKIENEKMGKGMSNITHFSDTLERGGQASASIVPGSVDIVSGSVHVTDDGSGHLIGSVNPTGVNTIDYPTGAYNVEFSPAPASGANILATYKTVYSAGSSIHMSSSNYPAKFDYITPISIPYGDTVKVQDMIQSKFYMGFNNAIWMTKQALQFQKTPQWFKVASLPGTSATQCLALSHDGNYLFVGTSAGNLYRIANLRLAEDSINADVSSTGCIVEKVALGINSGGRAITSIAVDPGNANNVVVTLGNYGESIYVYYSANALDSAVVFSGKQGTGATALPKMPVYASLIPMFSPEGTVMVGTEYGVYSTANITSNNPTWSDENGTTLAHVPVYMLRQQQYNFPSVKNYGTIYAATHGRGIFECTKYTSINDPDSPGATSATSAPLNITMYPNPVIDNATLSFTLPISGDAKLKVYEISGKLVKAVDISKLSKGLHTYELDCSSVKTGTYIIQIISGGESATTKFLKM